MIEEMSSGSFEIDTFSWFQSLPLSNCTSAYSTGTMFAVGECSFLKPYSFYEYQSTVGFQDTSTLKFDILSTIHSENNSTTTSLINSINSNTREFISTVPMTRWISSGFVSTYPFTYTSTFLTLQSTIPSTLQITATSNFISTGFFGFTTSNIYPSCSPYTYYSTIPVTTSSFTSTIPGTIQITFVSTLLNQISSLYASSFTYNFTSTVKSSTYPIMIPFSNIWLGEGLQSLIDSKQYDVFVDCQYSIAVSTNQDNLTWVSSIGAFGYPGKVLDSTYFGRTTQTRVGNTNAIYSEIHTKQMFKAQPFAQETELATFNSNYYMNVRLMSTANMTGTGETWVDIFAPGENNFTFTLIPVVSTIV